MQELEALNDACQVERSLETPLTTGVGPPVSDPLDRLIGMAYSVLSRTRSR